MARFDTNPGDAPCVYCDRPVGVRQLPDGQWLRYDMCPACRSKIYAVNGAKANHKKRGLFTDHKQSFGPSPEDRAFTKVKG